MNLDLRNPNFFFNKQYFINTDQKTFDEFYKEIQNIDTKNISCFECNDFNSASSNFQDLNVSDCKNWVKINDPMSFYPENKMVKISYENFPDYLDNKEIFSKETYNLTLEKNNEILKINAIYNGNYKKEEIDSDINLQYSENNKLIFNDTKKIDDKFEIFDYFNNHEPNIYQLIENKFFIKTKNDDKLTIKFNIDFETLNEFASVKLNALYDYNSEEFVVEKINFHSNDINGKTLFDQNIEKFSINFPIDNLKIEYTNDNDGFCYLGVKNKSNLEKIDFDRIGNVMSYGMNIIDTFIDMNSNLNVPSQSISISYS